MCICAGVCETVAVVAVGGYIVRKLRKRPAQKVCVKCGAAPQARIGESPTLCFDCYYESC